MRKHFIIFTLILLIPAFYGCASTSAAKAQSYRNHHLEQQVYNLRQALGAEQQRYSQLMGVVRDREAENQRLRTRAETAERQLAAAQSELRRSAAAMKTYENVRLENQDHRRAVDALVYLAKLDNDIIAKYKDVLLGIVAAAASDNGGDLFIAVTYASQALDELERLEKRRDAYLKQ